MKELIAPIYYFVGNTFLRARLKTRWIAGKFTNDVPLPSGYVARTREWMESGVVKNESSSFVYREIHPPFEFDPPEPQTVGERIRWKPQVSGIRSVLPTFIARIPGGRIYGQDADVITPDNRLLADVSLYEPRVAFRTSVIHPGWIVRKFPAPQKLKGRVAVLASTHTSNYFHWMLQLLPRLELFRLGGLSIDEFDAFIARPPSSAFHRETLQHLGIPDNKLIQTGKEFHAEAEELWVTSSLQGISHESRWVIGWLKHTFLPANPANGHERIFISRSDAKHRILRNEAECFELLQQHGFQKVTLTGMPVPEQARIFSSARYIVGSHGAGLTNLAFCSAGTRVLEFITPDHIRPVYWQLAACANLQYTYLKCARYVGSDATHQDITVDCALV